MRTTCRDSLLENGKGFTNDYSNSDQDSTKRKNVASTPITTSSTTVIANTNIQSQVP